VIIRLPDHDIRLKPHKRRRNDDDWMTREAHEKKNLEKTPGQGSLPGLNLPKEKKNRLSLFGSLGQRSKGLKGFVCFFLIGTSSECGNVGLGYARPGSPANHETRGGGLKNNRT
jgi:hypothetical protein